MKYNFKEVVLITLLLVTILGSGYSQKAFEINADYVASKLKALSADELKGRGMFTEGIDKAAAIIADDFKDSGLSFLPGLDSYKQEFKMYSLNTESTEISLDGQTIDIKNIFGLYKSTDISWAKNSEVEIITVTADQRFQEQFSIAREAKNNTIVLVDKSHEKIYSRYQQYFSRGSTEFEKSEGNSVVFILTSNLSPTNFTVNVRNKFEEKSLANVAGMIEGKRKDEIVLFSGHYDHIGIQKAVDGDSIANGANDDASGTTAVMALGKYFKEKNKPERTIYFVAFTAEEVGGFGSQYFSKQLNPDQIVAMFNIEMIGKPAVEGPNTAWITGFERSNFGELLQKSVEGTKYEFYADPYPDQNLFYRSDNATLARLGVPAHSISTTPIDVDKDYHQVTDAFETIDIDHMTNTIRAISAAAERIISGKDTPTRVDKSKVD